MTALLAWLRALWCQVAGHEPPSRSVLQTTMRGRHRVVVRTKRCTRCGEVLR